MGSGPAGCQRAKRNPGKIALRPTPGKEFLHRSPQPCRAVTVDEALFEERLEDIRCAVRMIPHQMFGIEPGPILFKDAVVSLQLVPHLSFWMGSDNGDLRNIEF